MKYNPDIHKRKTIRLSGYDYSQEGLYFVTISVQNKLCLFGKILGGEIFLNDAGEIIEREWNDMENRFGNIKLHNYIVMPNHFHAIIEIHSQSVNINLGDIIGGFKSLTTNKYIELISQGKVNNFNKKLWQRNYYEHIIRNEKSYGKIYEYIENNVKKWDEDIFYMSEM